MTLTRLSVAWVFIAIVFTSGISLAQGSNQKLSLNEGTIENQFNYVIQKSDKLDDSRLVKSWWLYRLKTHVLDSMKAENEKLIESVETIAVKDQEIVSLKSLLETTNEKLDKAVGEKHSMVFFGISMNKSLYNTIMWALVAVLAAGLILYFILFKRSNSITTETKKSLSEIKEEYEDYRKRALAREQKTVRKLYDEILKYKSKATNI